MAFGGLKAARRARDLKQLKQAVKDVKKSGFATPGKVALANAEKPVAIPGHKQPWASTETEGEANERNGDFGEAAAQTE